MACHIIEAVKEKKFRFGAEINEQLELVEQIYKHRKEKLSIDRCKDCGQLFIYCFRELLLPILEDDYFSFWIPIEQNEVEEIKQGEDKYLRRLIKTRSQIYSHSPPPPEENVFEWRENGNPNGELLAFNIS